MNRRVSRETPPWAERPEADILMEGAARVGVSLTGEQTRSLMRLMAEIRRWNRRINLIGPAPPAEQIVIHLIDSLTPLPFLPEGQLDVMDLGSGSGLPGLVLAMIRPAWRVALVETRAKKADFLRHVRRTIGPETVEVVETRLEGSPKSGLEDRDLVTVRALGHLDGILALTGPRIRLGGRILAYKGPRGEEEVETSRDALSEFGLEVERIEHIRLPFIGHRRSLILIRRTCST